MTSSPNDISKTDGQSIKELLASLEKEVDRQLAEDARLPPSASGATPAEINLPPADQVSSSTTTAPPAEERAVEHEPILARTGYDSPSVPSTPLPTQAESAAPPNEPLLVSSEAAEPEPRLSSEVFPIHEPPIFSDTQPLRHWDVEPRPLEYRSARSSGGKRVALATLLVFLVAGSGYAYYNRYGFDLQGFRSMGQSLMAPKSAPAQLSPPSAGNDASTSEIAKASPPADAEENTAPPPVNTTPSEAEGAQAPGDRNSTSLSPVEPVVASDVAKKCPEAVQALGLCASMGKK